MLTTIVRSLLSVQVAVVMVCLPFSSFALTRWSTLHYIPDADFLDNWKYVAEYAGYLSGDEKNGTSFRHSGFARIGLSEWADIQGGYAGGVTLGMKVKVLSEAGGFHPSVAVGVSNILRHKEAFFYDTAKNIWKNEYFLALGKSIDPIRLRLHCGVSTMPEVDREKLDYFFALEKYLGGNAYLTIEAFYRDHKLHPSLFGSLRFFDQSLEICGGAVDLLGIFMDRNGEFAMSFSSPRRPGYVVPGVWLGLRFQGTYQLPGGPHGGFGSLEEHLNYQKGVVKILKHDVDSLKRAVNGYDDRIDNFGRAINRLADSAFDITNSIKFRNLAIEQLTVINTLYGQEDFDPEKVVQAKKVILDYGNVMVSVLQEIALDNKLERKVRTQAMTMLGELSTQKSSDAVLDIMGQTQDPDIKIEGIIAIGKAKDVRAFYLLDQLASDPNTTIAFTASEVIQKLEKIAPRKKDASGKAAPALPRTLPEKKIDDGSWDKFMAADSAPPPGSAGQSTARSKEEGPAVKAQDSAIAAGGEEKPGEKSAEELANESATVADGSASDEKQDEVKEADTKGADAKEIDKKAKEKKNKDKKKKDKKQNKKKTGEAGKKQW